jgi:transposase
MLEVLKAAVEERVPRKPSPQQTSSLEGWLGRIEELWKKGVGPRAIYDTLRLEEAFREARATLSAVKRVCVRLKRAHGVQPEDVAIPVETRPGEVAQVDFGYVGRLYDPRARVIRKAWVFVMVLGYSRHMFARIVFDQTTETWLRLHVEAFEELCGVVEVVVPDNLKAAVIRAAFRIGARTALNRSYRELARHYGFKVDPTPVYAPEKKGKVESGVSGGDSAPAALRRGGRTETPRSTLAKQVRCQGTCAPRLRSREESSAPSRQRGYRG